jgi:Nif-specific regulatory protein
MIGNSNAMRSVYMHIEQVAGSITTVLIRGESGVGKELVARALHEQSPRKGKAFVKFNCAALPESIIESELFGHERGAFTGAVAMRKGRFEIADGGTIFLDEIGDLSPATQVKLLRVLQEKEFERVGSQTPIRCNVRIITATSRNLEEMIEQEKFRADLYYRLNVFPIYVPPLRERKSDILLLADHFVEKFSKTAAKMCGGFPPRRLTCWPAIIGPATCANWKIASNAPSCCARTRPSRPITCRPRCRRRMLPKKAPAAHWNPPWPRSNTK